MSRFDELQTVQQQCRAEHDRVAAMSGSFGEHVGTRLYRQIDAVLTEALDAWEKDEHEVERLQHYVVPDGWRVQAESWRDRAERTETRAEAERETRIQWGRERQDALDEKRWIEARHNALAEAMKEIDRLMWGENAPLNYDDPAFRQMMVEVRHIVRAALSQPEQVSDD